MCFWRNDLGSPIREASRLKTDLSKVDMQNDLWFLAIVNEGSMINKWKGFGQILERARIAARYDLFRNGVATLFLGRHLFRQDRIHLCQPPLCLFDPGVLAVPLLVDPAEPLFESGMSECANASPVSE